MTRIIAILACAAPLALATTAPDASLRGGNKVTLGNDESVHVRRALTEDSSDDGAEILADTEEEGIYQHVGCYADSKDNRVLGHRLYADDMTAKMCHIHCNVRGAFYMATQFGSECWCSREQDLDYQSVDAGVCDYQCSGDATESCGGYEAFDLYELVWAAEPTDPEYMDCYNDKKEDRIMSNKYTDPDMTQAACRSHCDSVDAMYYATQYGNECWCGTSDVFSDYDRHGEGTCHMPCSGNDKVACGGFDAFSLYRYIDDDMPDEQPVAGTPDSPTPAPQKAPTASPVAPPTAKPVAEPTAQPVAAPTAKPVAAPTAKPVPAPTPSPVAAPTAKPVPAPTPSPVKPPTPAPVESDDGGDNDGGGGGGSGEGSFDDTTYTGEGTYYGATTGGNCAFGSNIPSMYDGMIPVALNDPQYGDSLMCGACIEGEGSGEGAGANPISGKFKAYVSDKCPECKHGDLDWAESGDGRWNISWKFVPCPGSNKPSFIFEGSHEFYWKLQPRGTDTPVVELSVNGAKGERTDDNFFIVTEGVPFYGEQMVMTKTVGGTTIEQEVAI